MQISNRLAGTATQDSLANLAARAAGRASEETVENSRPASFSAGSHDPSEAVSLSVEALFILSGSRDSQRFPALTEEERNNVVSPALEERELAAFRHCRDEGDMKGYYRAYIEYFDKLQPQDQSSPRYAGSRQIAVSALRSLAYAEKAMADDVGSEPAVIDTILASGNTLRRDVPQMMPAGVVAQNAAAQNAAAQSTTVQSTTAQNVASQSLSLPGGEARRGYGISHVTSMYLGSF